MDTLQASMRRSQILPALRELRAPLTAFAVLCLVFQATLPLAAASGSAPGYSICLGSPIGSTEDSERYPAHSALCLCGQVCPHAGLSRMPPDTAAALPEPDIRQANRLARASDRAVRCARCVLPQSRGPPILS